MLGAIIGDIAGSRYEFTPTTNYYFDIFCPGSRFTDDTVCTIAIADALLRGRDFGESLHEWCRKYRHAGFGGYFRRWVDSTDPQPYGSFGNGSAMRVSPIAWWYRDPCAVSKMAAKSAECTHNHPEGIRGAVAVALAIADCRTLRAARKDQVLTPDDILAHGLFNAVALYIDNPLDFKLNLDDYRNKFDATCQGTVPVALWIVMHSTDFEDAIRRAVSLAADADTLGAIVGSIAETLWPIPQWMKKKALAYLPADMREVLTEFRSRLRAKDHPQALADTSSRRPTPPHISQLADNEIFVFGSNLQGQHAGGAARTANLKFGAQWGVGVGPTGRCYAIPTMHGGVDAIRPYVDQFIEYAKLHPELIFLLTRVGCGIAGFRDADIAPLFAQLRDVPNVTVPREWMPAIFGD